jgi:hydrogenase-4 component F
MLLGPPPPGALGDGGIAPAPVRIGAVAAVPLLLGLVACAALGITTGPLTGLLDHAAAIIGGH